MHRIVPICDSSLNAEKFSQDERTVFLDLLSKAA